MNTTNAQEATQSKKPGNRKRTITVVSLVALLAAAGAIGYQVLPTLSAQDAQTETVYKESPVARGDLTVGVSESGTTTLETLTHTFSVATTVDEVLVKAGQYVEKGDVLVKLDSTDIQEELTELQSSLRTAQIKYQEQLLQQKLTQVSAEATLQETLAKSDTASMEYELSIDDQDLNVISAKSNLDTIQESIDYYTDLLNGEDEDDLREKYGLDDILEQIDELESEISYVRSQIKAAQASSDSGCGGCSDSRYIPHEGGDLDELSEGMDDAKFSYQQYKQSYNELAGSAGFTVSQITASIESGTLDALEGLSDSVKAELKNLYERWQDNYELYQQYAATIAHVQGSGGSSTQLENLQSQLSTLQTQLNAANNSWDTAAEKFETEYDEAEDKIAELETQKKSAEIKYQQALLNQQINAITSENSMNSSLNNAENAQTVYELALLQAQSNVLAAEDSVQTLQNQIAEVQEALEESEVKARCSGLVMSVYVSEGDEISDGAMIAMVSNSEKAYVSVSISQDDIADISIGKECNLLFGAYSDEKYTGVVDSISTSPARSGASTVSYTVSILVNGDCTKLYEGMTADVTFITKEVQDVLYVSNRTVSTADGKQYVKVKREDGSIETVEVTTGFSDGSNVEIRSGLEEGDVALIESTLRSSR